MIETEVTPVDGPAVARSLAALDPDSLTSDQILDALELTRHLDAWKDALLVRLLAVFAQQRPAVTGVPGRRVRESFPDWLCEYAADEVAPVLLVSPRAAQERLLMAINLTESLPNTMAHLGAGQITLAHARTIASRTGLLDLEDAHTVEDQVLPKATEQTPTQLRAHVDRAVIRANPAAAQARRDEAVKGRRVEFAPYPDGLASLWMIGPAEQIAAARTGIEAVARRHRRALGIQVGDPGDEGIEAYRFDAAVHILTGGALAAIDGADTAAGSDVSGTTGANDAVGDGIVGGALIQVTMAATTALGLDDQPAELAGIGPITAEVARAIAHRYGSQWQRILTDPASGLITDISPTYRPSARMAALVRARNPRCVFPGCTGRAENCDLDHTLAWPHGQTRVGNLGPLCRHHHRLKTHGRWKLRQLLDGTWEWTSPTGRIYYLTPDTGIPPPDMAPEARGDESADPESETKAAPEETPPEAPETPDE